MFSAVKYFLPFCSATVNAAPKFCASCWLCTVKFAKINRFSFNDVKTSSNTNIYFNANKSLDRLLSVS